MATKEELLRICQVCPFKQRFCTHDQPCACTADGVDIREHARDGHCPQNMYPTSPPPPRSAVSTLAHGAAGIARAVTGTGGADEQVIQNRTNICTTCEHNVLSLGLIHRCELCGCLTWAKTRNLEEKCPAGKW
ncbi:MAG TPA: hypothetical protein VIM11_23130 [Tepidisphaeraceae bacterium]|jgi:hypothetical protein